MIRRRADLDHGAIIGTGLARRERTRAFAVTEQGRNAEIEQARLAVGIDEHVARLDVAMDQQPGVRELHGLGNPEPESQTLFERKCKARAMQIDAFAFDPFHREPQPTVIRATTIEQARNIRMTQIGQNLPLAPEQLGAGSAVPIDEALERDLLRELAIIAFTEMNDAHAAATQLAHHAKRTEPCSRRHRLIVASDEIAEQHPRQQCARFEQGMSTARHGRLFHKDAAM